MESANTSSPRNIVVDLDGTLIKTDLLLEQLVKLVKQNPLNIVLVFVWLLRGVVFLKTRLATEVEIDIASLPYRGEIIEFLKKKKAAGCAVYLFSASHQQLVRKVADHLGVFDACFGTGNENLPAKNLKGKNKLLLITKQLNNEPFVYIGDSPDDLVVWAKSNRIFVVNPTPLLEKEIANLKIKYEVLVDRDSTFITDFKIVLKQLRVYQWAKNLLVFVPLVAGQYFFDVQRWIDCLTVFVALSFASSAVYILNDVFDLEADRKHSIKKMRPLAQGTIKLGQVFYMASILVVSSLVVGSLSGVWSLAILLAYYLLNVLYSLKIKQIVALDIVVLAGFYTLRIFAGGVASSIPVSSWLLAFSSFCFLGLALLKRYVELQAISERTGLDRVDGACSEKYKSPEVQSNSATMDGRGYMVEDRFPVFVIGVSSSLLSVLVFALYINSQIAEQFYRHTGLLWIVAPILLYWQTRLWILAHRGVVLHDPVLFALCDRASWIAMGTLIGVLALSI